MLYGIQSRNMDKAGGTRMNTKLKEMIKDSTLCSNNLQVKFYLGELKKKLKKMNADESLLELVNDSQEVLRIMKHQGQKMEDRLKNYYSKISELGFIRKK